MTIVVDIKAGASTRWYNTGGLSRYYFNRKRATQAGNSKDRRWLRLIDRV